jgi:hypothetical protein
MAEPQKQINGDEDEHRRQDVSQMSCGCCVGLRPLTGVAEKAL